MMLSEMNYRLSFYIRGQIIVSFCIGFLLFIGYLIIGFDYVFLFVVIVVCMSVVLYLGLIIVIMLVIIIVLVMLFFMLLKFVIVWIVVQFVEGKLIFLQIMGKNFYIYLIIIIFVFLIVGKLFGVVGIILVILGYVVIKVVIIYLFDWFKMCLYLYEEEKNDVVLKL